MKDLDAERAARAFSDTEREFRLGGETFRVRVSTSPDDLAAYWDVRMNPGGVSNAEFVKIEDRTMKALLEPDYAEIWDRVRKTADPALNARDITEAIVFAMEVQAGRPTEPSPSSSTGSATEKTSTSSKDDGSASAAEGSAS